jgi:hypothetical protein
MTLTLKILIVSGAAFLLLLFTTFVTMTGWYDTAVKTENTTIAQWKDNQNTYDAFWKTVKETAQVPDKYKEDFKQLLVADTSARYGADGSKATMQWLQEHQINFDSSMYRKIQDVIESGRQDFKRSQTLLLDKQRKVADMTQSYWGGVFAKHYSFPRELHGEMAPPKDVDGDGKLTVLDYPIVTSARTAAAFQSGQDEALNVFGK